MLLYVIRHGEPIYDPDMLTERGLAQAEAVGRYFATVGLDRVFSSPNVRARQTAEPTCRALGLEMSIEPWTSEDLAWKDFSLGFPDGSRRWVFAQAPDKFRAGGLENAGWDGWLQAPGVEKLQAPQKAYQRIIDASDDFLRRLGYAREGGAYRVERPNDERVALFCHGGFSTFWFAHLLGVPPHIFWSAFTLPHSCISRFFFANFPSGVTVPRCLAMAELPHVYKEGVEVRDADYGV
ncbi:MAG: histidine phosphatase family protein [Planctomycetes bacterium]|nr:histidine phosphatase family protein [Planctomycetota bacterium]